jgi:uncharacterized protein with NRDE domain
MCLLFFSYRLTPGYRLVLAANRDEFLERPTAPLDYIDEEKTILAGRDLRSGGTWLGLGKQGRVAAITNYRQGGILRSDAPSRGEIIDSFLRSGDSAEQFLSRLQTKAHRYNGFSLVMGDNKNLFYFSNRNRNGTPEPLKPGFHGLCNHFLDTPWPKLVRGKRLLRPEMVETDIVDPERIFALLQDSWRPEDDSLPETGVGLEWERLLGTIFIDGSNYGTRSSAVITIKENGETSFHEKTWNHDGKGEFLVSY